MISQLVHKGTRPSKEACYTPFNSQVKKVPAEVKNYYFSDTVSDIVDNLADGRILHLDDLNKLKGQVQSIWTRSEQRKAVIIQEMRDKRQQYADLPLGVQHQGNKIVRLSSENAKQLVKDLNIINRIVEAAFANKPVSKFTELSNRELYKQQSVNEIV